MASASWPRVAVVGAGAVGGYFGGMLARAGAHVTLIGRPVHVDVWTRDGLVLDSVDFQERIPVAASTEVSAARDADLVLFSVKSPDTEQTAQHLARHVRSEALIVSLQNGVDNVERMRAAAARTRSRRSFTSPARCPRPVASSTAAAVICSLAISRDARFFLVRLRWLASRHGSRRRAFPVASRQISKPTSGPN
jgi:pyrroline-5-carboxylate reductase